VIRQWNWCQLVRILLRCGVRCFEGVRSGISQCRDPAHPTDSWLYTAGRRALRVPVRTVTLRQTRRNLHRHVQVCVAGFYARKQLCFQRILAIAILSVCLSVRLSFTRVDQAKTVQARISKFSPSAAWKTLVSGTVKLFVNSKGVTPNEVAKWEGGGQNLWFFANNSLYLSNGAR